MNKHSNNLLLISLLFINSINLAQGNYCSSAAQLFPSLATCNYVTGSSAMATQSLPGCAGNADDDVWYYFIANSTEITVKVDPTSGYDPVFELFFRSMPGNIFRM